MRAVAAFVSPSRLIRRPSVPGLLLPLFLLLLGLLLALGAVELGPLGAPAHAHAGGAVGRQARQVHLLGKEGG